MKGIRSFFFGWISLMFISGAAWAESRIWTDVAGQSIEAEYVTLVGGRVVLRMHNGNDIRISVESLSEEDREYVELKNPPRIDINVASKTAVKSVNNSGSKNNKIQTRVDVVFVQVDLKKAGSEAYDQKLTVEIFLMGREIGSNQHILLDQKKSTFSFTGENQNQYTSIFDPIELRTVSGSSKKGFEYKGYLVVVSNKQKEVIAIKASRLEYEKNMDVISKAPKGTAFDKQFEVVKETDKNKKD